MFYDMVCSLEHLPEKERTAPQCPWRLPTIHGTAYIAVGGMRTLVTPHILVSQYFLSVRTLSSSQEILTYHSTCHTNHFMTPFLFLPKAEIWVFHLPHCVGRLLPSLTTRERK